MSAWRQLQISVHRSEQTPEHKDVQIQLRQRTKSSQFLHQQASFNFCQSEQTAEQHGNIGVSFKVHLRAAPASDILSDHFLLFCFSSLTHFLLFLTHQSKLSFSSAGNCSNLSPETVTFIKILNSFSLINALKQFQAMTSDLIIPTEVI